MRTEDQTILFFDGQCGLCSRFVRFARKRDRTGQLSFAPIGGQTWIDLFGSSNDEMDRKTVHFVDETKHFRKSAAVVRLLLRCRGAWPGLGCLLWLIPSPLRNLAYDCVAKNRYRIFGKTDTCPLASEGNPPCMLP